MIIRIIISFRGVIFAMLLVLGMGIFQMAKNSRNKMEYDKSTGTVYFLEKSFKIFQLTTKAISVI